MECIKAGKKVTDDTNRFYFLQNGYICSKDEDDYGWHNTSIDTDELSRIEVEEEELKFEEGKFYRTRDGRKARCFFASKYLSICKFTIDGLINVVETNKDGEQIIPGRFDDEMLPTDIVGYWE